MAKGKSPRRVGGSVPIDSVKHKDKRKNIPTEELGKFMTDEDKAPKDVKYPGLLYARDPSLDPQLVWKGKDEQDQKELVVPAVPIYIQEKIHPQGIVEDVRAAAREGKPRQVELFADFNGIKFEEMIDFYRHEANWSNRMILGDSLLVMTSLAEKEGLKGKVQMIYIDPPYGIKFGSNWQVSTRKRDVKDGKAEDATRQPEQIRAFRDTWELGIHSYLAYWRDRLVAARELLTETGSVFVQIGDENVHLVRCVLDEVLGSENFVSLITIQKSGGLTSENLPSVADYLLWYCKHRDSLKYRNLFTERGAGKAIAQGFTLGEETIEADAPRYYQSVALTSSHEYSKGKQPFDFQGKPYLPGTRYWSTSPEGLARLRAADRLLATTNTLRYRMPFDDFPVLPLTNIWGDLMGAAEMIYVVQTNSRIIQRCLLMATDPGDLVLDPTCGSGTTAYVAEQWGRRWITVDTSRVALALARTRLMTARYPYYILADSAEGIKKEAEVGGSLTPIASPLLRQGFGEHAGARGEKGVPTGRDAPLPEDWKKSPAGDIRKGFVYRRVPHVTLKAIANNEEIDEIHARWQEKLEPLLKSINKGFGKKWEEWEVPREASGLKTNGSKSGQSPDTLLREWWDLKRQRQAEIDASIARRAETETLYDQPYEDGRRIRVTGPFTVESLSPHRTISVARKKEHMEVGIDGWRVTKVGAGQFGNIVIENMRKAGVQNTIRNERLKFDRLEVFPGAWIHATGEYTDKDGKSRRVAVCIGPEHGTVGAELVHEAAKEAVQGVGYDILIVAGFAFDPSVSEEAKKYGNLTVLPTRINADLQLGDEYLKKTGAGNLFMVFGEPDVKVTRIKDRKIVVEIKGLDVYDPTTGQVRSNTTADIACWFVDTDYNGESFFVRHAYFTGGDEPYEKLKRALRAEIDESAWSALYSTVSRPFDKPETGKIAVKVINHYGDEVMKVYEVGK